MKKSLTFQYTFHQMRLHQPPAVDHSAGSGGGEAARRFDAEIKKKEN